jgi:hypothetical protein
METGKGADWQAYTSYGLFAVFRYTAPQIAPTLDYGTPLVSGGTLCIVTRWKPVRQQRSQSI